MNHDSRSLTNSATPPADLGFSGAQSTSPNPGGARSTHKVLTCKTTTRMELINLTEQVREAVRESGVRDGLVLVSSMHTTFSVMVNEWQEALLEDIRNMLGTVVPVDREYRHNDPRYSDCDRQNAHAHLQAVLLRHSITFGVIGGVLTLGQFQAIIAAELDGPRERQVTVQILAFA